MTVGFVVSEIFSAQQSDQFLALGQFLFVLNIPKQD
jgi:hypothetical protein